MRLYSRTGATAVQDPEYGHFEANDDGTFDLPDELAERELRFHDRGVPRWETEIARQRRISSEDLDRQRDPATLLNAVQQILAAAQLAQGFTDRVEAGAQESAPKVPRGRKPAAKPSPSE